MKPLFLIFAVVSAGGVGLRADTIFQTTAQGKQVVVQRDAIVVKEDSSVLVYKHFDLKERRVVKVTLSQGSLPYSVSASPAGGHQQIVDLWKRFGHTVTLKDDTGKTTTVRDAYLDFYPPGGRGSLLESVPARTTLPVLIDGGGADDIDFEKITQINLKGLQLSVTLRDGTHLTGKFLMPTDQPAEARVLGISDQYDPDSPEVFDFYVPLTRLTEIRFE
jgi:hypothetical protein